MWPPRDGCFLKFLTLGISPKYPHVPFYSLQNVPFSQLPPCTLFPLVFGSFDCPCLSTVDDRYLPRRQLHYSRSSHRHLGDGRAQHHHTHTENELLRFVSLRELVFRNGNPLQSPLRLSIHPPPPDSLSFHYTTFFIKKQEHHRSCLCKISLLLSLSLQHPSNAQYRQPP